MAKRKPLSFNNEELTKNLKESTGKGVDALFTPTPSPQVSEPTQLIAEESPTLPTKRKKESVVKTNKEVTGIELKWKERTTTSDFSNLGLFNDRILLTKRDFFEDLKRNFIAIPLFLFLALF